MATAADRNRLWIWGILLGVAALGGIWFYQNFERDWYDTRTDQSPEARRNPLLAAQRLLERLQIPVESHGGREPLLQPPEQTGVMFVYRMGVDLPAEAEERLLEWVSAGGHLVLTPTWIGDADEGSGNRLLDRLEVWLEPVETDEEIAPEDPAPALKFPDTLLSVEFAPYYRLQRGDIEPIWQVDDDRGALLMQFSVGSGLLTVLSDNEFLDNERIGDEDHALFLARLIEDAERVWLLYSSDMPSLLAVLWKRAPLLLPAIALALLLWSWGQTRRSGPLLPEQPRIRRNLLEHLSAAADYAWRVDRAGQIFQQSRVEIEQEWIRRHPALARLNETDRAKWIAERTGITPRAIQGALYGGLRDERGFIATTMVQQRLAMMLRRGRGKEESGKKR